MKYLIDGNNLAHALFRVENVNKEKLLKQMNIDAYLTSVLDDYFSNKTIEVHLVFDGNERFGDKKKNGTIQIYYAPKDKLYTSADDKIVDIYERLMEQSDDREGLTLVSDDRELIERVKISQTRFANQNKFGRLEFIGSSAFAEKIHSVLSRKAMAEEEEEEDENRNLSDNEMKKINNEMLRLWKR